jgi:hypothetical protein
MVGKSVGLSVMIGLVGDVVGKVVGVDNDGELVWISVGTFVGDSVGNSDWKKGNRVGGSGV